MSEATITLKGSASVTIYSVSIEDTVNKMVIPLIFAKTSGSRDSKTTWKIIDLNRTERIITLTGKVDSLASYYVLKSTRARGGTVRLTHTDLINNNDPDWYDDLSCLNLCITSCTITETAQDLVDSTESPVFDVVLTGRVAALDEI